MSADGKIAGTEHSQVRISSDEDLIRVRGLRKRYDAILVGVGTVLADDPHLTAKGTSQERNPVRIVLDTNGRTPDGARVLDDQASTVIITGTGCTRTWGDRALVIRCGTDSIDLPRALDILAHDYGIRNVLVEGGGTVIASFFRYKLVDKYSVFIGGLVIGGRTAPTPADGEGWVQPGGVELELTSTENYGNGVVLTFIPKY
ncbi:MAG: dihydrofolate reductase family protein [Candidatus Methanomethylophilus sp.]|jgi:2,5-diamino-6-(ribosylamino)-4(3H)-pyrimidinone 5'-phosphate reductase|nr:dihydrofolate reductase family protein [Methanomethylophilus sp.]MDD4222677.1 dihydrofolate reductase family protein [Methanomethylophilus sp.]